MCKLSCYSQFYVLALFLQNFKIWKFYLSLICRKFFDAFDLNSMGQIWRTGLQNDGKFAAILIGHWPMTQRWINHCFCFFFVFFFLFFFIFAYLNIYIYYNLLLKYHRYMYIAEREREKERERESGQWNWLSPHPLTISPVL